MSTSHRISTSPRIGYHNHHYTILIIDDVLAAMGGRKCHEYIMANRFLWHT
jgi:hypothetical protein